jgi:hypothetical protein
MASVHASKKPNLGLFAADLYRLKQSGYADSRVTPLTTVDGLIADIQLLDWCHKSKKPIADAACDAVRWMKLNGYLTDTLVAALTTVYDTTVSASTDLGYLLRGAADYPSDAPATGYDLSTLIPTGA